jgi:hypothetical protein
LSCDGLNVTGSENSQKDVNSPINDATRELGTL